MNKRTKPSIKIRKAAAEATSDPVSKPDKAALRDVGKPRCWVSGKVIPPDRIKALIMLGVPAHQMTCVEHSQATKKQGVYLGEHGTSQMLVVDKVYNDSVRDVFSCSNSDQGESDDVDNVERVQVDEKTDSTHKAIQDEEAEE